MATTNKPKHDNDIPRKPYEPRGSYHQALRAQKEKVQAKEAGHYYVTVKDAVAIYHADEPLDALAARYKTDIIAIEMIKSWQHDNGV